MRAGVASGRSQGLGLVGFNVYTARVYSACRCCASVAPLARTRWIDIVEGASSLSFTALSPDDLTVRGRGAMSRPPNR